MKTVFKNSIALAMVATAFFINHSYGQTYNIPTATTTTSTYVGTTSGDFNLKSGTTTAGGNINLQTNVTTGNVVTATGNSIILNTNGGSTTPNIQVNNTGQVGIGMVPVGNTSAGSPYYYNGPPLQVYGSSNNHVPAFNPSDIVRIKDDAGGSLGIGVNYISTGSAQLTLNGSLVFIPKLVLGSAAAFSSTGSSTTTPGSYDLYAGNGILTGKVKVAVVNSANWADFVFDKNYKLLSLSEVEKYIKKNKHLPDVPSADEVVKEGINLGEMDAKLLQKIEELTLYMIEMKKENEQLKSRVQVLEKK